MCLCCCKGASATQKVFLVSWGFCLGRALLLCTPAGIMPTLTELACTACRPARRESTLALHGVFCMPPIRSVLHEAGEAGEACSAPVCCSPIQSFAPTSGTLSEKNVRLCSC